MNKQQLLEYISFRVAVRYLKKNNLYDEINKLIVTHKSTGVSLIDFAVLYDYIKRFKPQYVLECGTGLSTHIIAAAMSMYSRPKHKEIKLISMESEQIWHQEAIDNFPFDRYDFVEILLSKAIDHRYSFVCGVIYENVPSFPYDFIFVDGPDYKDKCDMDFIKIVENSEKKISALIDSRRTSALAYSALLGRDHVVSYPFGFSYVRNVSMQDLALHSKRSLHHSFDENIPKTNNMFIRNIFSSIILCLFPMRIFD